LNEQWAVALREHIWQLLGVMMEYMEWENYLESVTNRGEHVQS
jgi:hypothetical protein